MSQFAAPTAGGVAPRDLVGHLVIAAPVSYETGIETTYGPKDAIALDLADLDTAEVHEGLLWFNGRIVGALKRQIGTLVLARVTEGIAKAGQKPPYELVDATSDAAAVAKASTFVAAHPEFGKTPRTTATSTAPSAVVPADGVQTPAPAADSTPASPATNAGISPDVLSQLDPSARALVEQLTNQRAA